MSSSSKMSRQHLLVVSMVFAALLILCTLLLFWSRSDKGLSSEQVEEDLKETAKETSVKPSKPQLPPGPLNALMTPGLSPARQTEIIGNLYLDYWIGNRSLPTGTMEEMAAALAGDNKRGAVYVPRNHPALGEDAFLAGEDQLRVHIRSSREGRFEVIHSGEDKLFFTDDDLVRPFPLNSGNP
ncbi:MAG: hypothetical protein Q7Q71_11335 [Verrucomicrobiota bacterium JB023]|nr:hypothetical protein [Verrucomicrobiota bacterium JB023]